MTLFKLGGTHNQCVIKVVRYYLKHYNLLEEF